MIAPPETEPGYRSNGVPKPGADDVYVFPATVRQQGFWYLDQLQPGNPAYNIAVRFRLQGSLHGEALERALGEILRRHESLRTVFAARDGVPMQVVTPRLSNRLERDDLREGTDKYRHERAEAITAEEGRVPFDLARGPLFRARLLCLADEEHILLVTVHHIVSDGWSIGVLIQELGTLYDAYCQGRASPLPELPLQYPDFAVWQKEWLRTTGLTKQLSYWTRQLANLPALEIPSDRPRRPIQTFSGAIESILLPKDLTDHLASLGHRENATLFMLLLAAFELLLHRLTGQNDIFVGSVVAGRTRVELEPLIGLFINPLVFRTNLSGDPPFIELLARVRETVEQAFANQDVPFERVVDAVQPKRDPSRHPLFQINFLYQRDFVQPFHASGLTLTAIPSLSPGALYDLNFFLVERAEGWRASCEYNSDLYEGATVRRLLDQFETLLEGIAADPVRRISEFSLQVVTSGGSEPPDAASHQTASMPSAELTPESYQPPRDAVESQLAQLWERLLKVKRISITADFFDLGGHSLLAAQLLAQVGKAFGTKVPLAAFLHSPTIASLAVQLQTEKAGAVSDSARELGAIAGTLVEEKWTHPDKQVFPMRLEGTQLPLILVDAGPFHRPLVRSLGSDQPVLGVALPDLSLLPKKFTVKDVAANLVQALQESKVAGPYCLAGWSQAGVIAYEMAQQFRSRGQDIALLILLDTNSPEYLRSFDSWKYLPIRLCIWFEKVLYHLWKLRGMPLAEACRYFRERMHRFQPERITRQQGPQPDDGGMIESWKMQYLVAGLYQPEPCDWPLVLVRSRVLQTGWFRDPLLGWGEVAQGGLQLFEMPGEHDAMFLEPDVRRLGSILQQCLRRATAANSQA